MIPVICVGAIYIDTILSVPHFPREDGKLRASGKIRRRGGNCGNSLEVLSQLLAMEPAKKSDRGQEREATTMWKSPLLLISALPDKSSVDYQFIERSLGGADDILSQCIVREGRSEAASSYIIRSQDTGSRTIVSSNELGEMTFEEFKERVEGLKDTIEEVWFHFEGRIPETTLQCVRYLREKPPFQNTRVSIELEKPDREGLVPAAKLADVIFFSRIWAEKNSEHSCAESFLRTQLDASKEPYKEDALLVCTWGASGATACRKQAATLGSGKSVEWVSVPAWAPAPSADGEKREVVDSVGAGDTFIAGMLWGLTRHTEDWDLSEKMRVACELAGRKVFQEGYDGVVASWRKGSGEKSKSVGRLEDEDGLPGCRADGRD